MAKLTMLSALAIALLTPGVAAADGPLDDLFGQYLRRLDSITPGAGNARDVNAVTHVIDPWHRYTGDPRIPANGERMVGAVERYRDVRRLGTAPPPLSPSAISPGGVSGTATTATSTTTAPAAR